MRKRGFTLIEIMIVTVLLAILAALFIPRFGNQAERARINEAQQQLSAMRRAQKVWQDGTGNTDTVSTITDCGAAAACNDVEWSRIGMTPPSGGSFDYGCGISHAGPMCWAKRVGGRYNDGLVVIDVGNNEWACGSGYELISLDQGCTV